MSFVGLISLLFILCVQKINSAVVTSASNTKNGSDGIVVDGVNLSLLSEKELQAFLVAEDEKLMADLDIWSGRRGLLERLQKSNREKRSVGSSVAKLAFKAGSAIFRGINHLVIHVRKNQAEKEYERKGYLRDAVRDFYRLRPYHVRKIHGKEGYFGLVGRVGHYTAKVERKEKGDEPTLELYITNKYHRKILRRVTYEKPDYEHKTD